MKTVGKTQRSFQKSQRQKKKNAMQQAVTEWLALTISKEVPILTKDTALTLLRFLKVQRWKHINESWLHLMEDWLDSEDNRDDSWKEEPETRVFLRNLNLTQESVRLGTDGPRPPKLRRMNAYANLDECLDAYANLDECSDDFRRFLRFESEPPPEPEWLAELGRRAAEWLEEMGATPVDSTSSDVD